MKTAYWLIFPLSMILSSKSYSQATQEPRTGSAQEMSFTENLRLTKACFVNEEIPQDFPNPSKFTDERSFRGAVYTYIRNNPEKFNQQELEKNGLFILGLPNNSNENETFRRATREPIDPEELKIKEQKQNSLPK
jgi:hypothetical protein